MFTSPKYPVKSQLLTLGVFPDYVPKTPLAELILFLAPLFEVVRRGIEQLFLELRFFVPYFSLALLHAMGFSLDYFDRVLHSPTLRNRWVLLFLLTTVALLY